MPHKATIVILNLHCHPYSCFNRQQIFEPPTNKNQHTNHTLINQSRNQMIPKTFRKQHQTPIPSVSLQNPQCVYAFT